jgi:hypothetical protein
LIKEILKFILVIYLMLSTTFMILHLSHLVIYDFVNGYEPSIFTEEVYTDIPNFFNPLLFPFWILLHPFSGISSLCLMIFLVVLKCMDILKKKIMILIFVIFNLVIFTIIIFLGERVYTFFPLFLLSIYLLFFFRKVGYMLCISTR